MAEPTLALTARDLIEAWRETDLAKADMVGDLGGKMHFHGRAEALYDVLERFGPALAKLPAAHTNAPWPPPGTQLPG